jgi:hypothetical protein
VDEVERGEATEKARGHGLAVVEASVRGPVGVVDVCVAVVVGG